MIIKYRFRKAKISSNLKQYLEEKVKKLEKIVPKSTIFDIELRSETRSKKGKNKIINITVDIPGEKVIHISKASIDFKAAVDISQEMLEKVLTRWHKKKTGKRKRDRIINMTKKMVFWVPEKIVSIAKPYKEKIKTKRLFISHSIFKDEAIDEFKNSKEPFLIFENSQTHKLNLIFKKNSKNIIIYEIEK